MKDDNIKQPFLLDGGMRGCSIGLFLASVIPLGMGLYKMFAYENPELAYLEKVNAYVGGDAYNYIINSNLAIAYFVLFGVLFISGVILVAADAIHK